MIKVADVAHMYKEARRSGSPDTINVLYGLLVHGLGDKQRRILRALPLRGTTTSPKVSKKTGIQVRVVCNTLHHLQGMGLVDHEKVVSKTGIHYEWRIVHLGFDR